IRRAGREANVVICQANAVYTSRHGGRKPGFQNRFDTLRIHHSKLHRKRGRVGNKPVEGGLFIGSEPTLIRRQHREDKNFTLGAPCTATDASPWSSPFGGSVHWYGSHRFRFFTLVF